MNERIRELAEQAKAFIVEPEQAKIGEVSEVSFDKYSDLEKFAELIVAECINSCQKNYVAFYGSHASAHNSAVKKCIDSIEELKDKSQ